MSSREFTGWQAYNRLSPIGRERLDYLAGLVASLIANVNQDSQKRPYTPYDFMPKWGQSAEPADPDAKWKSQQGTFRAIIAAQKRSRKKGKSGNDGITEHAGR